MYQVEVPQLTNRISELTNAQLVCGMLFLQNTYEHIYHKKLLKLARIEKTAIIHDLTLYEKVKEKRYLLRSVTPKSWFEKWEVYNEIISEAKKREIEK